MCLRTQRTRLSTALFFGGPVPARIQHGHTEIPIVRPHDATAAAPAMFVELHVVVVGGEKIATAMHLIEESRPRSVARLEDRYRALSGRAPYPCRIRTTFARAAKMS
jgi:hypothetical protein